MDEWISTKDRLPKTEDYVLVWYHGRICTGYYHKSYVSDIRYRTLL